LILEDELTDDYLAGKLDSSERSAFEKHFLVTPERYQQLSFARALERHLARGRRARNATDGPRFFSRQSLVVRASLIAIVVAVVGGAAWLLRNQKSSQTLRR
jgi:ferric-dicitrate binding protein FerR (iron transport regulator)